MTDHDLDDDPHGLTEITPDEAIEGIRPYEKEEYLRELYHEKEWTQSEIADFYGVDQSTISKAMERAGVEARPPICKQNSPQEYAGAD